MKTNTIEYDHTKSSERINNILNTNNASYEELNYIPSRESLTHKNGVYVKCTALFVDIRGSSNLPNLHRRPVLAKIYRSYISEVVAIMNGNSDCKEIEIDGDCISGIYNTPGADQINSVFDDAARICSLVKMLNYQLEKKDITKIDVGIGIDYGRALMVKAGYSGSGLDKIVWMGDVVNSASNLCNNANKGLENKCVFVSNEVFSKLNQSYKNFTEKNYSHDCYHCDLHNIEMEQWYEDNCKVRGLGLSGLYGSLL